jgi:hypothetical protein
MNLSWHSREISKKLKIKHNNEVTLIKFCMMFSRIINIAFALFFFITTSGLTIQENFCYDKLVSVYVEKTSAKCCNTPCSGCHTRVIIIKVPDNFISTAKKQVPGKLTLKCPYLFCTKTDFTQYIREECSNDYFNTFLTFKIALSAAQLQVFRC